MPMEPDLYRALRAKDLRRVRECLNDWGNENRRVWWTGARTALTPLHVASKGSSQDILRELLRHPEIGRSINTFSDKTGVTPLHEAAGSSSPEVVRLLLDAGADLASPSGDQSTAFHIACSRGRLETCVELLRRGSLLEGRDAESMTPLLRAAANGRADVTKWLLFEGADPAAVDVNKNTALALSCRATSLDPARALLDYGADVIAENVNGDCCARIAAISGRTELLDMMLAAMAKSGQRFRDGGGDILYEAVDHGLSKVVDLLTSGRGRELGVKINRPNSLKQGTTPLHAACFRGQQGIVGQLLSRGAEPNAGDDNGLRPLHVACASPDSQPMVKSLLKAKADANVTDVFGCSPLYYAFVRGNDEIVRYMLSRGASLFRMDYDQALRIACFYGRVVEVESLLWMEADPSSVLFNHRDRGAVFHASVNSAIRDGINELLTESSNGGGGGGGNGAATVAAREAATAWGGGDTGCLSHGGTTMGSASSGWTSAGDSSRVGGASGGGGGGYQSSSAATSDRDCCSPIDHRRGSSNGGGGGRVRVSFGLAMDDAGEEHENDDIDDEDDAFIVPSMSSLENDLIREGDAVGNGSGCHGDASMPSAAAAVVRRWGLRMKSAAPGVKGGDRAESAPVVVVNKGAGLGGVKERARAKFAGVIRWASSPRARSRAGEFAG